MFHLQPVAAAVLHLRDDAQAKQYLLEAGQRVTIVSSCGGRLQTVAGAAALDQLLSERAFVCLHYHLDHQGRLTPCAHAAAEGAGSAHSLNRCSNGCHLACLEGYGSPTVGMLFAHELEQEARLCILLWAHFS